MCFAGGIDEFCPPDHPFAYLNGAFCCKTNEERPLSYNQTPQNEIDSGTCDGVDFNRQSVCCKDEKYIQCPHGSGCFTNTGTVQTEYSIIYDSNLFKKLPKR